MDNGRIYCAGLFIQWLTEAIAVVPQHAGKERAQLVTMRGKLIEQGQRTIDVVREDAPVLAAAE